MIINVNCAIFYFRELFEYFVSSNIMYWYRDHIIKIIPETSDHIT